jgi:hypothetical protein
LFVNFCVVLSIAASFDSFDAWMEAPLSARSDYQTNPVDMRVFDGSTSAISPRMATRAAMSPTGVSSNAARASASRIMRAADTSSSSSTATTNNTAPTTTALPPAPTDSEDSSVSTSATAASGQKRKASEKGRKGKKGKKESDILGTQSAAGSMREVLENQLDGVLTRLEEEKRVRNAALENVTDKPVEEKTDSVAGDDETDGDAETGTDPDPAKYFISLMQAYNRGTITDMTAAIDAACADNCFLRSMIVKFNESQPFTDREVKRNEILAYFKAILEAFPDSYWRYEPAYIRKGPVMNTVIGHFVFRCESC